MTCREGEKAGERERRREEKRGMSREENRKKVYIFGGPAPQEKPDSNKGSMKKTRRRPRIRFRLNPLQTTTATRWKIQRL